MAADANGACCVKLEGEWLMERAAELKTLLLRNLAPEAGSGGGMVIDLSEVADLDACCCQLLAVFLEHAQGRPGASLSCSIPQHLMDKIAQLGFAGTFAATEASNKENA